MASGWLPSSVSFGLATAGSVGGYSGRRLVVVAMTFIGGDQPLEAVLGPVAPPHLPLLGLPERHGGDETLDVGIVGADPHHACNWPAEPLMGDGVAGAVFEGMRYGAGSAPLIRPLCRRQSVDTSVVMVSSKNPR